MSCLSWVNTIKFFIKLTLDFTCATDRVKTLSNMFDNSSISQPIFEGVVKRVGGVVYTVKLKQVHRQQKELVDEKSFIM